MKHLLSILFFFVFSFLNAQHVTIVTYDFNSDLSAIVSNGVVATAKDAVFGGSKLSYQGIVTDGAVNAAKSTITNNNSTNYSFTFVRCDIQPKWGYSIEIEEIIITHRSSKAGVSGVSQTYQFRIGCTKNGYTPDNTDANQSTGNRLLPGMYEASSFTPGKEFSIVSGEEFSSVFFTPRGATTSNDVFDWYIDKIEIKLRYVKLLNLPKFSVKYSFENSSKQPEIEGVEQVQASSISSRSAAENLTAGGRYWIRINSNSNTISFGNMGLLFDLAPYSGYEIVLRNHEIVHAGSGVQDASCVNRIGLFRDISRSGSGVEVGRDDFTDYTGRGVYGDAVPVSAFKTSLIADNSIFSAKQFYTISVNRKGSPAESEYWTVDNVRINGWVVPVGRGELLRYVAEGEQMILNARVGEAPGMYEESVFETFLGLLSEATDSLTNPNTTPAGISAVIQTVQQAVLRFPNQANSGELTININTHSGIPLNEGFAGFNMRIADGPWTYTNPAFVEATKKMNPGFLRYFSGTSGDYFDIHTGQYVLEWFEGTSSNPGQGGTDGSHDDFNEIPVLYKWMEGKGAHRFIDFAHMCGEMGTKIVVTWNGFYESAHKAAQFARFCKNNNIVIDNWQFCNEPNFFTAPRRYFWNDGEDYAYKMKEIADSIRSVFPAADLSLSYGWNWGSTNFASQIKNYQNKEGHYWNTVSIHAYPTHRNADVDFYDGFITANKSLDNATSNSYFKSMEDNSWLNSNLLITEFGVWNSSLTNTNYSAIYVSEYYMRLSQQRQAWMIGKHQIASAFNPENDFRTEIMQAYENQTPLNTDLLNTGYFIRTEGFGHYLINKAFKNSSFSWQTTHDNTEVVPKRDGGTIPALYATSYKGINDRDYLLVTNKTGNVYDLDLMIDGSLLTKQAIIEYFTDQDPAKPVTTVLFDSMPANEIKVPPYSVMRVEWLKDVAAVPAPLAPRVYSVNHGIGTVQLKWWDRPVADSYQVRYGTSPGVYTELEEVTIPEAEISGLVAGQTYYFSVTARNASGTSGYSNEVSSRVDAPTQPVINFVYEESERITIHWESVPYANGYRVKYGTAPGVYTHVIDAGNITGYIFRKMENNQRYYISVSAFNRSGEGENAPEISAMPVSNRPWPPYLVFAAERADGTVDVSWTPSDSTHNAIFDVYYCPTPWDETNYELVGSNVSGTSFRDYHPRTKGYHYYRVKAKNGVGESVYYSNIATVDKTREGNTDVNTGHHAALIIYPNPAGDVLYLKSGESQGLMSYKVYNSIGRLMKKGHGSEINVADCGTGMLVIQVDDGKKIIRKIIVKK